MSKKVNLNELIQEIKVIENRVEELNNSLNEENHILEIKKEALRKECGHTSINQVNINMHGGLIFYSRVCDVCDCRECNYDNNFKVLKCSAGIVINLL